MIHIYHCDEKVIEVTSYTDVADTVLKVLRGKIPAIVGAGGPLRVVLEPQKYPQGFVGVLHGHTAAYFLCYILCGTAVMDYRVTVVDDLTGAPSPSPSP
jgi:hypothetical protein